MYQTEEYGQESILPAALIALAIVVILALIGLLLYRRRPSEAAGKAMAFPVTCPVIRILIVLLSGIGLGSFFWGMRESTGWFVFGVLCGTIISHCVIEIIYHFDFKRLFDHKGQLIVCGLVSLAVMSIFRYDLLGYDKYLPAADRVRSAAVSVDVLNSWTSYGSTDQMQDGTYYWKSVGRDEYIYDHMEYQDTENLLKLASYCVDYVNEKVQPYADDLVSVNIRYTLNSGRHVYRSYHVPAGEIEPMVNNMYADPEFQQATYPLMARTSEEVAAVRYKDNTGITRLDRLTAEEKKELLESYQQEFQNMTLEQMKSEYPLGLIRFSTEKDEEGLEKLNRYNNMKERYAYYYLEELENCDYYPVYPSFTKTLALLQQQKVWTGNDMEKFNVTSIDIGKDMTDKEREMEVRSDPYGTQETRMTVTIDDPAELEALKKILVYEGRTYYNPMYQAEVLEVEVLTEQNGEVQSYPAIFPEGSIPDFVEQKMTDSAN
ncbi:MAG: DUF6449 domain-containing protein [Lachnospiraceae bacterium]|nr:DUF6449 domain-containing protein [Lachnospiraceae bacterium]